ncbi:hypothetical protein F4693_002360 [Sphingomonas endophytica]|uniref:Peptidoglycan-binding protein n=1 Tax=Sphingomonas endophytica TaxID=869719 RepID=A0A7X0JEP1_9SPHN|nr:peptidoglycan-binding protein [Sphingomonas endophytica]MBB6505372.1 hypothetical protein [Sphingomonas endophytica]
MTAAIEPATLDTRQRAELIYAAARAPLDQGLWRAALGTGASRSPRPGERTASAAMTLPSLLATLSHGQMVGATFAPPTPPFAGHAAHDPSPRDDGAGDRHPRNGAGGLGANATYAGAIDAAAKRTGLTAPLLTAIIGAEAARDPDGRWRPLSRNPHSSAAGLGQFLTGTWLGEAQRKGTWLHELARVRHWLDPQDRVLPEARAALLALRYDGEASIHAVADYAQHNLAAVRRAGIAVGHGLRDVTQIAYLGHHLGAADAIHFLSGQIAPERARRLLQAQVGVAAAARKIATAGDSILAHRQWLTAYVARAVRAVEIIAR